MKIHINTIVAVVTASCVVAYSSRYVEAKGPLKVFILSGQSNMQGKAAASTLDAVINDPKTRDRFKHLKKDGEWVKREDVTFSPQVNVRQAMRFWVWSDPPRGRGSAFAVTEPGTRDWERHSHRFRSHPNEGAVHVSLDFRLQAGMVWIDDVSIRPAE